MFLLNLKELKKVYKNHFNLQYKMFLLNLNVNIEDSTLLRNLQYKMFLLNRFIFNPATMPKCKFTIQNVPIKSKLEERRK